MTPPSPLPGEQLAIQQNKPSACQNPAEQLQSLLTRLTIASQEADTAKTERTFKSALGRIYQLRAQIKRLVPTHNLPPIPANPWKNPASPMPEPAPVSQEPAPAPVEALRAPMEMTARQSIASIRRSIWLLMADLEQMPPESRESLADDLGLLDAAAHAAVCLAAGKLEIA